MELEEFNDFSSQVTRELEILRDLRSLLKSSGGVQLNNAGRNVIAVANGRGMSQARIAVLLGISAASVSRNLRDT